MSLTPRRHRIAALVVALASVGALNGAPSAATPPQPYRILIANDDGVRAPGILALALDRVTLQPGLDA